MELISVRDAALHLEQMGDGRGSAWGVCLSLHLMLEGLGWFFWYGRGVVGWCGLVGVLTGAMAVGV